MVKATNQDAFITDRLLYSVILKHAKFFIKRMDDANKLLRYQSLFEPLCVDLIEVSPMEACCPGIKTCCVFMRSKDKLPELFEGARGPVFRTVSSVDGSQIIQRIYPIDFTRISNTTNFKYNKTKYFWFLDGYAYFPNIEWDSVRMEVLPIDGIEMFKPCGDPCQSKQDEPTAIPEALFMEIEQNVKQELLTLIQIPKEMAVEDNQSKFKN